MNLASFQLDSSEPGFCIVLGLGLVGSSIANLLNQHCLESALEKVSWSDAKQCVEKIKSSINESESGRIELIWSAGRAGFSASADEMSEELAFYSDVITQLKTVYGRRLTVNLVSSAGGIYEDSDHVTELHATSAKRDYAQAKLSQERLLSDLNINHRIYRVSSVYGMGGSRIGLVSALLNGATSGTEVKIFAQQNTMRDYILNHDVARVIIEDVVKNIPSGTFVVASGRAVSINTLINMVSRITKRRVKAYFQSDESNERDISFARCVIHGRSAITSLEEGIALMHKQLAFITAA